MSQIVQVVFTQLVPIILWFTLFQSKLVNGAGNSLRFSVIRFEVNESELSKVQIFKESPVEANKFDEGFGDHISLVAG